jgi:hypothetical protein
VNRCHCGCCTFGEPVNCCIVPPNNFYAGHYVEVSNYCYFWNCYFQPCAVPSTTQYITLACTPMDMRGWQTGIYTGQAGTVADCAQCNSGLYKSGGCSGTQDTICSPCLVCPAGTNLLGGCNSTHDSICGFCPICPVGLYPGNDCGCSKCINMDNRTGYYTGSGTNSTNCPFSCNAGYFYRGNTCSPCPVGGYSVSNSTTCSLCTNGPPRSTYTGSGTNATNCPWVCGAGSARDVSNQCPFCVSGECI